MKTIARFSNRLLLMAILVGFSSKFMVAQNIQYTINTDNPDSKNLFIGINPFDATSFGPNTGIGYNIYANALVWNKFQFDIDYKKAYLDDNADGVFAPAGLKKILGTSSWWSL